MLGALAISLGVGALLGLGWVAYTRLQDRRWRVAQSMAGEVVVLGIARDGSKMGRWIYCVRARVVSVTKQDRHAWLEIDDAEYDERTPANLRLSPRLDQWLADGVPVDDLLFVELATGEVYRF